MEPVARREEILDAARAVFLLRGLRAATVDEITSRAGVAKGTFYLYFVSKDAILQALRERIGSELLAEVELVLHRKNRAQAISDFIATVVDFRIRNRDANLIVRHRPEGFEEVDSETAITTALSRFIADGVRAGEFDIRQPQATAKLLYGSLRDAFGDPAAPADAVRLREAAEDMFRAVLLRKHRKK